MKEVFLKNGKIIRTPWLKPEEAAAYCGISRGNFDKRSKRLPHGGDGRTAMLALRSRTSHECDRESSCFIAGERCYSCPTVSFGIPTVAGAGGSRHTLKSNKTLL